MDMSETMPDAKVRQLPSSLVVRRAPSKRSVVNEFQARHFAELCRLLVKRTLEHFEMESLEGLPDEGWESFTEMPEYGLFTTGVYACGFVCADLKPDADLDAVKQRPIEAIQGADLPRLRHYVHTLMRSERASYGYGSVIYEALRAGILEQLSERMDRGADLYERL
jgi:hypothetical protein